MTGIGYTLPAALAVVAVLGLEFLVWHTGLFRRPAYWISMIIVFGFQILVDGWLTKLSAPIVIYNERHTSGIRFPFDIPVEDFLFGLGDGHRVFCCCGTGLRSRAPPIKGHIVKVTAGGQISIGHSRARSTTVPPAYDQRWSTPTPDTTCI